MTNLKDTLDSMVRKYGIEQVEQSLREISLSEGHASKSIRKSKPTRKDIAAADAGKSRPRLTAPQYVAQMGLPPQKASSVIELASRFEAKSFLPSFGDIADFCRMYGVDVPASKSRTNSIPRVFRYIASMEGTEVQRILDEGLFSGPSRLGPIADAIRRSGRASAAANASAPSGDFS